MEAKRRRKARVLPARETGLAAIQHIVVLMLENRSFDHLLGMRNAADSRIDGPPPGAFNYVDPCSQRERLPAQGPAAPALAFDPPHEFAEVKEQVDGPTACPAPMSGFGAAAARVSGAAPQQVMDCFLPRQLPVFSALADEFAVFNYWYSSMPGPTWPNRFFVHAGTSGGLAVSPNRWDILKGFTFKHGTIYDRLSAAGLSWRIYHDDFPQVLGVSSLRSRYLGNEFRKMPTFYRDVKAGALPDYTFIEPCYAVFDDFVSGNSMHPHNAASRGEALVKAVYESIRNSRYWRDTMLIITFDEHGGFFDHVLPPSAPATGDDTTYARADAPFDFRRYGVRVPTIVVSAYTDPDVIGASPGDPATVFDHCSIPATVRKRYNLQQPLSDREGDARTVEIALNRKTPRANAPTRLPAPLRVRTVLPRPAMRSVRATAHTLTTDQQAFLALAQAMAAHMEGPGATRAARGATTLRTPAQAKRFAERVQAKVLAQRGRAGPRTVSGKKTAARRGSRR